MKTESEILKYLTGKLKIENAEQNIPEEIASRNEISTLAEYITTTDKVDFYKVVSLKDYAGNDVPNYMIAGYVYNDEGEIKYYFYVITDFDFNPVGKITEFSNGTPITPVQDLKVNDEDGRIYGIDTPNDASRFFILNNPISKIQSQTYYLKLNYTLYLSGTNFTSQNTYCFPVSVLKIIGESRYIFMCLGELSVAGSPSVPLVVDLTINVGSENEYVKYEYTTTISYSKVADFWGTIINGNLEFKILLLCYYPNDDAVYELYRNSTAIGVRYFDGLSGTMESGAILNYTTSYVIGYTINTGLLDIYSIVDGTITLLNSYTGPDSPNNFIDSKILSINGEVYIQTAWYYSGVLTDYIFLQSCILINADIIQFNGQRIEIDKSSGYSYYDFANRIFQVQKQFLVTKLLNVYLFENDVYYTNIDESIYSANVYVQNEYESESVLNPRYGILNKNGNCFARLLYNKSVYNNQCIATLEVPNTLLNDVIISTEELYSSNNMQLFSESNSLETNIYERLYFNFISNYTMSNENNPLNVITNNSGGQRLNNSINFELDYINSQLYYYRLINSDASYRDCVISKEDILINETTNTATLKIAFYKIAGLNSIKLLSADKETEYLEIDVSTCDDDKYYLITQDIEVVRT